MPRVVFEEIVTHYREQCASLNQEIQRKADELNHLVSVLGDRPGVVLMQRAAADVLTKRYESWLAKRVARLGIVVRAFPKAGHEKLVKRDLLRQKPFCPNGKGYRDALIWESILEHASETGEQIIFISPNHSDFCEGDELHPDLLSEVADTFGSSDKVRVEKSTLKFIEKYVDDIELVKASARGSLPSWVLPCFEENYRRRARVGSIFEVPEKFNNAIIVSLSCRDYELRTPIVTHDGVSKVQIRVSCGISSRADIAPGEHLDWLDGLDVAIHRLAYTGMDSIFLTFDAELIISVEYEEETNRFLSHEILASERGELRANLAFGQPNYGDVRKQIKKKYGYFPMD